MWRTLGAGMFISLAAAAAAPNVPIVPVEWKPRVVVLGVDRLGDLALDFEPDEKRLEKRRARRAAPLGDGERRGQRAARVGCVSRPNVRSGVVESCVSS